ncbi:hypothetical protein MTO96_028305 [Rhipicephalus appendiculatus]
MFTINEQNLHHSQTAKLESATSSNDSTALQDLLINTTVTDVVHCGFLQEGNFTFDSKGRVGFLESTPPCLTAFDVRADTHLLYGTWMEVWQLCNNMRGYLTSNEPGGWTDIVKKHGHLQSDSAGHPEVLEALQMSELLAPVVLPVGSAEELCFIVSPVHCRIHSMTFTFASVSVAFDLLPRSFRKLVRSVSLAWPNLTL